jgi:ATP-independent RNA helicase DbpA
MVINIDLPRDRETYVHRIGRTARAGKQGIAVSFYPPHRQEEAARLGGKGTRFEPLPHSATPSDFTMQAPNMTIVIEGGKKDKLRPGDIVGALTGEGGIAVGDIGTIAIQDSQSYVAIRRPLIATAYAYFKNGGKIKNRRFPVWILK